MPAGLVKTVTEFNAAVAKDVAFNPAVKDNKGTRGITPPKSHWAQPLDAPPYVGFAVTNGLEGFTTTAQIDSKSITLQ